MQSVDSRHTTASGALPSIRGQHLLGVRRVVRNRRQRQQAGLHDDVESGTRVSEGLGRDGVLSGLGAVGEHRQRRVVLAGLLLDVGVELRTGVRHHRGVVRDQAAVPTEAPDIGARRAGIRAVGVVERPAEVRHLLLLEVGTGIVLRRVADDGEHVVTADQPPTLRQGRGRVLSGVGVLRVLDLDAGDLVGVVETLDPGLDAGVGAGELRGDAETRQCDRRPVEASHRTARLGEVGGGGAAGGRAGAAAAAALVVATRTTCGHASSQSSGNCHARCQSAIADSVGSQSALLGCDGSLASSGWNIRLVEPSR